MAVTYNSQTGKFDQTDADGNVTATFNTHEEAAASLDQDPSFYNALDQTATTGGTTTMDPFGTGSPSFTEGGDAVINETTGQTAETLSSTTQSETNVSAELQGLLSGINSGSVTTQGDVDALLGRTAPTKVYLGADNFYYIDKGDGQVVKTDANDLPENVEIVPLYREGSNVDEALAKYGLTRQPGSASDDTVTVDGTQPDGSGETFQEWIAGPDGRAFLDSLKTEQPDITGEEAAVAAQQKFEGITAEKLGDGATAEAGKFAAGDSGETTKDGTAISSGFDAGVQEALSNVDFDLLKSLGGEAGALAEQVQTNFTPEGFAKLQEVEHQAKMKETDKALEEAGVTETRPKSTDSPYSFLEDTLEAILVASGYNEIKEASEALLEEINADNEKFSEEVGTINENPWISEGARNRQIAKADEKHQLRVAGKRIQYDALKAEAESQRQNAQWLASTAVGIHFQQENLDLAKEKFAYDRAEDKAAAAESERRFNIGQAADERDFNEMVRQFNAEHGGGGGLSIEEAFNSMTGPEGSTPSAINGFIATVASNADLGAGTRTQLANVFNVANSAAELARANPEGGFAGLGAGSGASSIFSGGKYGQRILGTAEERAANRTALNGMSLKLGQWASGATLTENQQKQVDQMMPTQEDADWEVVNKLNSLYNFMLDQVEGTLISEGVNVTFPKVDLFEVSRLLDDASPNQLEELTALKYQY